MLGWSINLFKVFGIQLSLHASFLLLLAYAGLEGWRDGGWVGMLFSVALTVVFFICVVLHELGHSLTARRYGVKIPRILLMPIGGMAEFDRIPREPSAEFLITIAGPLVNFGIVLGLWAVVGLPPGLPYQPEFADSIKGLGQLLLYWNALMGCFNLLPVFPMDGGRMLRALIASRLPYLRATWWAVMVGRYLALAFTVVAIYWNHYMAAVLFVFIFFAGAAEYRMTLRREQEENYWREMARRVILSPADGTEPQPPLITHGPG